MEPNALSNIYNNLKTAISDTQSQAPIAAPTDHMFHHNLIKKRDGLQNDCCKHIILDLYCKTLPLDGDWICKNMGTMNQDVDSMLSKRNMNAVQYMTACKEATKAPLLEFVLRSTELIGSSYMEEATDEAKKEKSITGKNPNPKDVSINDQQVKDMIVDIKQDPEFKSFMDKLKKKTVDKIVDNVSKFIIDKNEDKNMRFDPKSAATTESAFNTAMNYFQTRLIREGVEITDTEDMETMIGMCIREATMYEINRVFNQVPLDFRRYVESIDMGSGIIVNTNSVNEFITEKKKDNVDKRHEKLDKELKNIKDKINDKDKRIKKYNNDDKFKGIEDALESIGESADLTDEEFFFLSEKVKSLNSIVDKMKKINKKIADNDKKADEIENNIEGIMNESVNMYNEAVDGTLPGFYKFFQKSRKDYKELVAKNRERFNDLITKAEEKGDPSTIIHSLEQRMMLQERILQLSTKRCEANEAYHKIIKEAIKNKTYKNGEFKKHHPGFDRLEGDLKKYNDMISDLRRQEYNMRIKEDEILRDVATNSVKRSYHQTKNTSRKNLQKLKKYFHECIDFDNCYI